MKITTEATLLNADNVRQLEWIVANYPNWSGEIVYWGIITSPADDLIDEYVQRWSDYLIIGVEDLNANRAKQLENDNGQSLSFRERKILKKAIIKEKLENYDGAFFEEILALQVAIDKKKLTAIFKGYASFLSPELYGIYDSTSAAKAAVKRIDGYIEIAV